mmetsp:Transcript_7698/g.24691  ORF Transcript_7698/g.24691 Transcript_7698/m.24691 type:complete len:231 (+) Transcript_7698:392-1084(+)
MCAAANWLARRIVSASSERASSASASSNSATATASIPSAHKATTTLKTERADERLLRRAVSPLGRTRETSVMLARPDVASDSRSSGSVVAGDIVTGVPDTRSVRVAVGAKARVAWRATAAWSSSAPTSAAVYTERRGLRLRSASLNSLARPSSRAGWSASTDTVPRCPDPHTTFTKSRSAPWLSNMTVSPSATRNVPAVASSTTLSVVAVNNESAEMRTESRRGRDPTAE